MNFIEVSGTEIIKMKKRAFRTADLCVQRMSNGMQAEIHIDASQRKRFEYVHMWIGIKYDYCNDKIITF